jgi:chromosome segregation ATPase
MSDKSRQQSPLVKSVLALDNYLSELERVGTKINSIDMKSDFDLDYVQKLLTRFAECGQGVTQEVSNLSTQLQESQTRAESIAHAVSRQADLFNVRRSEHNERLEEFRILGDKVRDLNTTISNLRNDREQLISNLPDFETQLSSLIEDLEKLRSSAKDSRMRALEKNAESLVQTLQVVRKRLRDLNPPQ